MKTNKQPVQMTPKMLRQLIEVEVKKGFGDEEHVEKREKGTKEVDADEYGEDKNLEHPVDWQKAGTGEKSLSAEGFDKAADYLKALRVEEVRLTRRLARVQEAKKRAAQFLAGKI